MAMLAEKRLKSKFVLTPVAKPLWTQESSQFGKKMMEKMGWAAGKGLGASEQGIQEPLRAIYKQDSKGMGYSGQGNPFENLDQFNALLASLSGQEIPTEDVAHSFESLEEKSKHSRSRVHYKKFTRSKDVSRYSNVDLTCIVGSGKQVEEEVIEEEIDHTGEEEHSHGVTTINSGSIADYFKLKLNKINELPTLQSADVDIQNNAFQEASCTEEIDRRDKKRMGKHSDGSVEDSNINCHQKKDKNRDDDDNDEDKPKTDKSTDEVNCEYQYPIDSDKPEKKKRHRDKKIEEVSVEITNTNSDNGWMSDKRDISKKDKKKKKRDKASFDDVVSYENLNKDEVAGEVDTNERIKLKKMKLKEKLTTSNEETSLVLENVEKKKKRHKDKNNQIKTDDNPEDNINKNSIQLNLDENELESSFLSNNKINAEGLSTTDDNFKDKQKKKKKKKLHQECDDNEGEPSLITMEMNSECLTVTDDNFESTKKRKKKLHKELHTECLDITDEILEKKQKKKKKFDPECNDNEADSPSLISNEINSECLTITDDNFESTKKRKKKSHEECEKTETIANCKELSAKKKKRKLRDDSNMTETNINEGKNETILSLGEQISQQFKGSNLSSIPGYGIRRAPS